MRAQLRGRRRRAARRTGLVEGGGVQRTGAEARGDMRRLAEKGADLDAVATEATLDAEIRVQPIRAGLASHHRHDLVTPSQHR